MSHFNLKSLAFYGTAIGSVLLLFKVVTAYGENLKAPPPIDGRYRIAAKNLPKCLQSDDLVLIIQQSGIYLSGFLLPADKIVETTAPRKPSLFGRWKDRQLTLAGSSCNDRVNIAIQAVMNKKTMSGEMTFNSTANAIKFTAQREAPERSKQNSH